ncbi:CAAX prenyl protease-related protein [Pedosphaera parvula]|uniref:CAAX prenyl protease-related protein n=1 Tax=Pedosphaera parvula (strain Ellin514) TaxID=320771 RepID=B9XSU2_PEDPL|nr:CAAX prenyl protease-related protein [Pedosphaera parvula]EEF57079.1 CAAX prenyl protease-related protein [Pedosphaera parvula Ellin514]
MARVVPFLVFVLLTACQDRFGEASRYWIYFAKTIVGAWLVWMTWPIVKEMRWAFSWEAVVVGVAVFAIWVGLDPYYPKLGKAGAPWNPNVSFVQGSGLAWFFILTRIIGSTLVVPPIEEVFYRSFLYRYIVKKDFQSVALGFFHPIAFLATSAIFGISHYEWLAGILCGVAYQGLVIYKKRLGDAMTAHAITNFLLGVWVVYKGAWQFW